ncbi:MAG: hypothetical protein JNN12_04925 [Bacteroidetes Order II. Incertae sedis bacterium]|nr:hypothetical protein [Bacteroidetes Order II. bacterium]
MDKLSGRLAKQQKCLGLYLFIHSALVEDVHEALGYQPIKNQIDIPPIIKLLVFGESQHA